MSELARSLRICTSASMQVEEMHSWDATARRAAQVEQKMRSADMT